MDELSLAELEQLITRNRKQVLQVADEIKTLLEEDLPRFVEREMKRGFIASPDFAAGVGDDTLRRMKQEVSAAGVEAAKQIVGELSEDLWFPEDPSDDQPRKTIAANERLWGVVGRICDTVRELQQKYGYPDPEEPITYKPPTWFIGRRYLPSLSERYWRHVSELSEALKLANAIRSQESRTELTRRWDEV